LRLTNNNIYIFFTNREVPAIEISESPGLTGNHVKERKEWKKTKKSREGRSKSIEGLHIDDSPSEGGSTDDDRLVSSKILRKTNVKKEGFDGLFPISLRFLLQLYLIDLNFLKL